MATTGFNLENQDLSLLGLESDNRDSELERDVPFTCVSAAKPCDVTPSDSLKDHFGSGAIEEMNISGEHPVSLLSLDVATVRLGGAWQFGRDKRKLGDSKSGGRQ